jgi:hypothetical protein
MCPSVASVTKGIHLMPSVASVTKGIHLMPNVASVTKGIHLMSWPGAALFYFFVSVM